MGANMVKGFLAATLMVLAAVTICGQIKYSRLERQLFKLQRDWLDARQQGNLPVLDRIEAPDFIGVDGDGKIFRKKYRNEAGNDLSHNQADSMDTMESRIRVFGKGAIITGRLWLKRRIDGRIVVEQFAYTHTFVKGPNGWQIVASQLTQIPS